MKFLRIVAIAAGLAVLASACASGGSQAVAQQTVEGEPVFASIARVAAAQVANGDFDSSTATEVPGSFADAKTVDSVLALSADLLGPTADIASQMQRLDPEFAEISTLRDASIEAVSTSIFYLDPVLLESDPEFAESEVAAAWREQGAGWFSSTVLELKSSEPPEDVIRSIEADLAEVQQVEVPFVEFVQAADGEVQYQNQVGSYTLLVDTFRDSISYFVGRGGFEDLVPASNEMVESFEAFAGENFPQGSQGLGTRIAVKTFLGEPEIVVFDYVEAAADADFDDLGDEIATTAGWELPRDESSGELLFDEQGMIAYEVPGMMARMSLDNSGTGDFTASLSFPQGE